MTGVGGGGGQPPALYPHHGLPVQAGTMYISQSQVHGLHTGPHQQSVYPMNNQIHQIHQVLKRILYILIYIYIYIYYYYHTFLILYTKYLFFSFFKYIFIVEYEKCNAKFFFYIFSFLVHHKGISHIKIRRFIIRRFHLKS